VYLHVEALERRNRAEVALDTFELDPHAAARWGQRHRRRHGQPGIDSV
jgi:hypothetical protein